MLPFKILSGLPETGPRHIAFPAKGRAEYSEGFVVQFFPETREAWIGNFAPGWSATLSGAYDCFGGGKLLVISSGSAWLIDPEDPSSAQEIDALAATSIIEVPEYKVFLLVNPVSVVGVGHEGLAWRSRRISWDGFRSLAVENGFLTGESWTPVDKDHEWVSFRLNVRTGEHQGGAYTLGY